MKTSVLALSLLSAIPFVASAAQGLSYNYVGSDYVRTKADQNAKGWALKAPSPFNRIGACSVTTINKSSVTLI